MGKETVKHRMAVLKKNWVHRNAAVDWVNCNIIGEETRVHVQRMEDAIVFRASHVRHDPTPRTGIESRPLLPSPRILASTGPGNRAVNKLRKFEV